MLRVAPQVPSGPKTMTGCFEKNIFRKTFFYTNQILRNPVLCFKIAFFQNRLFAKLVFKKLVLQELFSENIRENFKTQYFDKPVMDFGSQRGAWAEVTLKA